MAEHLKRIRRDYCKGSLRDTLNAFVPQAAGPRRAHIRVPEPIKLERGANPQSLQQELRTRMQMALDQLNEELDQRGQFIRAENPFLN